MSTCAKAGGVLEEWVREMSILVVTPGGCTILWDPDAKNVGKNSTDQGQVRCSFMLPFSGLNDSLGRRGHGLHAVVALVEVRHMVIHGAALTEGSGTYGASGWQGTLTMVKVRAALCVQRCG